VGIKASKQPSVAILCLDAAYEELLAQFRFESQKHEERKRDLERENQKLKGKVHMSRKPLDEQERSLSLVEKEADEDQRGLQQRLDAATASEEEKDRRTATLEAEIERLTIDAEQGKEEARHDKELLSRIGEHVENYRGDQDELERMNDELERRV